MNFMSSRKKKLASRKIIVNGASFLGPGQDNLGFSFLSLSTDKFLRRLDACWRGKQTVQWSLLQPWDLLTRLMDGLVPIIFLAPRINYCKWNVVPLRRWREKHVLSTPLHRISENPPRRSLIGESVQAAITKNRLRSRGVSKQRRHQAHLKSINWNGLFVFLVACCRFSCYFLSESL